MTCIHQIQAFIDSVTYDFGSLDYKWANLTQIGHLSNYLRTFRSTIIPVTQKDTKYLVKHPFPEIVKTVKCSIWFLGLNMSSLTHTICTEIILSEVLNEICSTNYSINQNLVSFEIKKFDFAKIRYWMNMSRLFDPR